MGKYYDFVDDKPIIKPNTTGYNAAKIRQKMLEYRYNKLLNALNILHDYFKRTENKEIDIESTFEKLKYDEELQDKTIYISENIQEIEEYNNQLKIQHEEQEKQAIIINEQYKSNQTEQKQIHKRIQSKQQFTFNDLIIQRTNTTSFTLPNEKNKKVTAYKIIELLAEKDFKTHAKKITFKNNKIQILPYSERIRLIFHFRRQYKKPLVVANADTIAAFINTALFYTNNIQLSQNWAACLAVTGEEQEETQSILDYFDIADDTADGIDTANTADTEHNTTTTHTASYTDTPNIRANTHTAIRQAHAASLLTCYGWAYDYSKEFPKIENAFYTCDIVNGERHYNIVNDDITARLAAIEHMGRGGEVFHILTDKKAGYSDKEDRLNRVLKPLLWYYKGVRLGLTEDTKRIYDDKIKAYIDSLLEHNAFDNITLAEHIYRVEIDKNDTDIIFAQPQAFIISLDDMEFSDYDNLITSQYNKDNAAQLGKARSKKAARKNFENITGNEWTTQELKAQGITKNKITRLVNNNVIERISRGRYRRITS